MAKHFEQVYCTNLAKQLYLQDPGALPIGSMTYTEGSNMREGTVRILDATGRLVATFNFDRHLTPQRMDK